MSIDALVELSRRYGANPSLVLGGGGNTSVKDADRLLVKASGTTLATIDADGFVALDRSALAALLDRDLGATRDEREAGFKAAVLAARLDGPTAPRPSVEAVLHDLMPARYVVHLHSTVVNQLGCAVEGKRLVAERLGDDVLWIDLVDPGIELARAIRDGLAGFAARTGGRTPRGVVLQNHGVVVSGADPAAVDADLSWLLGELEQIRDGFPELEVSRVEAPDPDEVDRVVRVVGPTLRALTSDRAALNVVLFDDSDVVLDLVTDADGEQVAGGGPLIPDQIVYCRSFPMWFAPEPGEDDDALAARLTDAVAAYRAAHGIPPTIVLVAGVGMFAAGARWADADTARAVYRDAIAVMVGARRVGGVLYMTPDSSEFIENWEVEAYRRQVAAGGASAGRVAGKVAVVTGAAQGFGLGIAQDLAAQGAHVVLADLNADGVATAAAGIVAEHGAGRAVGVVMNVADGASVAAAVDQVVRAYGGLDLFVSNAGVLRAESVKTQSERDFDLSTDVNYKGYFLCVQGVAPVLARQHAARPEHWTDIVQINSKSGLVGSNKNFAYAGSKFGGIGLTQSFALELVTDGVKVNSICPGNFYDGPLWSDPENGLFVQYLRTGKVPGATTVEEVKAFYEAKVPMSRGCTTPDVMTAVYYLVDQKYETGQALPVTGGQVMLH
ncbi:SDR family NAD(P)-dependent oxidoreductase [Actinotalea sp. M2MS4P-6]|uniref:SDR family NAD(P)-dependent oxidoreductase n=1 Tax=Actinotalea sp. M2MS4P-6 TaxID=2983762 RepID=UPI0021E39A98|nr:SDR family NAD(P)-dependent oxidoreductase [Actinotalea sp. M2MS4P-6]MCV2394194.1 SDR family NAD(P)-dependent oxidoreductase [Actinotalea sp. M2MS4P-6]